MMTSSAVRPGSRHGPDDNPIGKNWIESMAIAVRGPTSTAISARSRPNESLLLENLPGYRQRMQSCTLTRSKLNRGKLWYIGTLSGGDLFFPFFPVPWRYSAARFQQIRTNDFKMGRTWEACLTCLTSRYLPKTSENIQLFFTYRLLRPSCITNLPGNTETPTKHPAVVVLILAMNKRI